MIIFPGYYTGETTSVPYPGGISKHNAETGGGVGNTIRARYREGEEPL